MSYIRCLSNPEGLYIWADVDSTVHITTAAKQFKEPPRIPTSVFDGLLKKWNKQYYEYPCEYKGAKVDEVWIPTQNRISVVAHGIWSIILSPYYSYRFHKLYGKYNISHTKPELESYKLFFRRGGRYQIRLSYGEWHVDMWQVTWEHVARH